METKDINWPFEGETPLETVARLMREKNDADARAEKAEQEAAAVARGAEQERHQLQWHATDARDAASVWQARAERAEKRLEQVLALTATEVTSVYVGRAGEDLGLNPCAQRVVDLIHSRATEGADATTGAMI